MTEIFPVVRFAGTVTVSDVVLAWVTVAETPLKVTASAEAVALNPVPMIVTLEPTGAGLGENEVMVGAGGRVMLKVD